MNQVPLHISNYSTCFGRSRNNIPWQIERFHTSAELANLAPIEQNIRIRTPESNPTLKHDSFTIRLPPGRVSDKKGGCSKNDDRSDKTSRGRLKIRSLSFDRITS